MTPAVPRFEAVTVSRNGLLSAAVLDRVHRLVAPSLSEGGTSLARAAAEALNAGRAPGVALTWHPLSAYSVVSDARPPRITLETAEGSSHVKVIPARGRSRKATIIAPSTKFTREDAPALAALVLEAVGLDPAAHGLPTEPAAD